MTTTAKRLLSAGCTSGEGPCPIAITLEDTLPSQAKNRDDLTRWLRLSQLNLTAAWNVVIDFDTPTQGRLFARFAEHLRPRGHVFVGQSESLHGVTDEIDLLGYSSHRRRP